MNRTKLTALTALFALAALAAIFSTGDAMAQSGGAAGQHQYARNLDDDGDGIPNCSDPDYIPPQDGTGNQFGNPGIGTGDGTDVIDPATGDGEDGAINRLLYKWRHMIRKMFGGETGETTGTTGYGPGDGTCDGDAPADGTGYGPGFTNRSARLGIQ